MIFIGYLRWGHVARSYLTALFDPYLNSVIIGRVHTSSEYVEAGFNYPLLQCTVTPLAMLLAKKRSGSIQHVLDSTFNHFIILVKCPCVATGTNHLTTYIQPHK
jgi:hypothetical protein